MTVICDSMPAVQDLRINILMDIRDEIDHLYDEYVTRLDELASRDFDYIASSMLPSLLYEPEGLPDPLGERRRREYAVAAGFKNDMVTLFENERLRIPKWAIFILQLLFNAGMDTTGKTIAVQQGLYYINVPPGKPQPEPWTAKVPKATD